MNSELYEINLDSSQSPHWSRKILWRDGRWDNLCNAPTIGNITWVRGRTAQGETFEMHYACGGGDDQPPFKGWFRQWPGMMVEVFPIEWQPLSAKINEENNGN